MNKGLAALKRIRQETCPATYNPDFDKEECCNIIEAELIRLEMQEKVLKIVEEKHIDIRMFRECARGSSYEEYKEAWERWHPSAFKFKDKLLTPEEYELLKEALCLKN